MSEHNYTRKVEEFIRDHSFERGRVSELEILHDGWCGVFRGGRCDCDPVIRMGKVHPKPTEIN